MALMRHGLIVRAVITLLTAKFVKANKTAPLAVVAVERGVRRRFYYGKTFGIKPFVKFLGRVNTLCILARPKLERKTLNIFAKIISLIFHEAS